MLGNVMPHRSAFFNLLAAHTDRLMAAANATLRLISGLGNPSGQSAQLIEEVNANEASADHIKADFIQLLYESFTTPISRDQLHTLIAGPGPRAQHPAAGRQRASASTTSAHRRRRRRALASLGADACLRLNRAVVALADRNGGAVIVEQCHDIDAFESMASTTMREAVTNCSCTRATRRPPGMR